MQNKKVEFTPVTDRVVILPELAESESKGGILIPDTARKQSSKGFVVSIGKDVKNVKEGDYVYYDQARCGSLVLNEQLFHIARDMENGQIDLVLNS